MVIKVTAGDDIRNGSSFLTNKVKVLKQSPVVRRQASHVWLNESD